MSAQDDKHKVVLPDGDWEFDGTETEFSSGDQVKLKYNGTKFVSKIELIALPTRITVTPATMTLAVGKTETLTADIYPDNAENKNVTWESDNTSVVTVDATTSLTTTVRAVAPGTAKITVTTEDNNKSAEITVVVGYAFSVSATKQVVFSPGNLQYNATTNEFLFAASQAKYRGDNQGYANEYQVYLENPDYIIDLFGWGMWLDGTDKADIIQTSTTGRYAPELKDNDFKNNQTTVNGTEWFTLTRYQWDYLITHSQNAWRTITVNGTSYNGLVILPDDCTKNVGSDDWSVLESAGAVFLPAAGIRVGKDVQDVGIAGYYW